MDKILLVLLCLVIGILFRRLRWLGEDSPKTLATLVVRLALPAVTLREIHRLEIPHEGLQIWLIPASMAWICFVVTFAFFQLPGIRELPLKRRGALVLMIGACNTSFVGFPLLESLLGSSSLGVGVLVDQPGSFVVVSTVAVMASAYFSGKSIGRNQSVVRQLLLFPPFLALLAAVVTYPLTYPDWLLLLLDRLGALLVPLAVLQAGTQLSLPRERISDLWMPALIGLLARLVLWPAIFASILFGVLRLRGMVPMVTTLESAMAPMITAAIVATEYDLDPKLVQLMTAVGIPLSLLTVPAWYLILMHLFPFSTG
jgi:predicted permease